MEKEGIFLGMEQDMKENFLKDRDMDKVFIIR